MAKKKVDLAESFMTEMDIIKRFYQMKKKKK